MCTLRSFEYTEITNQSASPALDLSEYVKKSELEQLLNSMLGGTSNEQSVSTTKSNSTTKSSKANDKCSA